MGETRSPLRQAGQFQPMGEPAAQILRKSASGKKGAKEMHPLEASRALKRISAHIQMADGARVPGVRMVADGAWVRVDIATNK